ncbi:unnamed protein product [Protopolystoma xenopodis]|uniref:Uncharacterized protein n=1 Tax=Protopolystoma xenopodis TaxID=117903 RepID=A0A3S5B3B5_9PLAT|nr:unnamed protein product [Protopolystoma xenopodis]
MKTMYKVFHFENHGLGSCAELSLASKTVFASSTFAETRYRPLAIEPSRTVETEYADGPFKCHHRHAMLRLDSILLLSAALLALLTTFCKSRSICTTLLTAHFSSADSSALAVDATAILIESCS